MKHSLVLFLILFTTIAQAETKTYYSDPIFYSYAKNQKKEVSAYTFGKCLGLMSKASKTSYFGKIQADDGSELTYADFVAYLAAQQDRKDFATGKEKALQTWVLSQKDNSVDLIALFEHSLFLNGNNVWAAFVSVHDLLRTHARWWIGTQQVGKGNGGGGGGNGGGNGGGRDGGGNDGGSLVDGVLDYFHLDELAKVSILAEDVNGESLDPVVLSTRFYNKLVDIRGDLRERGSDFHGDHKGTWYRIWGMMLYRLLIQGGTLEKDFQNISSTKMLTEDERAMINRKDVKTKVLAFGVELEKIFHGNEEDKRKTEINLMASTAAKAMWVQLYAPGEFKNQWQPTFEQCHTQVYMKDIQ